MELPTRIIMLLILQLLNAVFTPGSASTNYTLDGTGLLFLTINTGKLSDFTRARIMVLNYSCQLITTPFPSYPLTQHFTNPATSYIDFSVSEKVDRKQP